MLAGSGYHTRAFVEWEEWPRSVLIAAQRAGYFALAPIWDDLRSFDAQLFRGAFDIVLAGYPCQPFSAAGKRGGADDPRHPMAAAYAWRSLSAAHDLGPVDMAAERWAGRPSADEPL
jgi:site-specific DNA-cytosine methylase